MTAPRLREGSAADIRRCNLVWLSTQPDIGGVELPDQPLAWHELRTGRLVVVEVAGEIVAFGATLTRSGVMYLADLFAVPAHQGRGLGRLLLGELVAGHDGPLFTFASSDPRAKRLYEQFGMHAVELYHYLDVATAALRPWPGDDVELVPVERAGVIEIDNTLTGRDRVVDIDYATGLGAVWYGARRDGQAIGVVAVVAPTPWNPWHPRGLRIGPVMAHDEHDIEPILGAVLSSPAVTAAGADVVSLFAPSGLAAHTALLDAGFEIVDTDLLMSRDDAVLDRRRYVPTVDTP